MSRQNFAADVRIYRLHNFYSGLVEKIYHMEGKAEQRKLRELCEQIPMEHLRLTQDLIEYITYRSYWC